MSTYQIHNLLLNDLGTTITQNLNVTNGGIQINGTEVISSSGTLSTSSLPTTSQFENLTVTGIGRIEDLYITRYLFQGGKRTILPKRGSIGDAYLLTEKLAIGTTDAQQPLHIFNSSNATIQLQDGGSSFFLTNNSGGALYTSNEVTGQHIFSAAGTYQMGINQTGVGIGTEYPQHIFQVKKGSTGTVASFYGPSSSRQLLIDNSTTTNAGDTYTFNSNSATGELAFGNSNGEIMRINDSNNVGIGTTTPSTKLEVNSGTTYDIATFENNASSTAANINIKSNRTSVGNLGIISHKTTNDILATGLYSYLSNTVNDYGELRFYTRGADGFNDRLTIDENGNVGINTETPSQKLHINSGAVLIKQPGQTNTNSGSFYNGLTFVNYNTNHAYGLGYDSGGDFAINFFNTSTYTNYLSLSNTGNLSIAGWVRGGATGSILNTVVYDKNDTNIGNTLKTVSTTTYTSVWNVSSISYTPVSSSSRIVVEYDVTFTIAGFGTDTFSSRIVFGGTEIAYHAQESNANTGGGTRSGTLFPIMGMYRNTSTTAKNIQVECRRISGDDNILLYRSFNVFMRITEIQD